MAVTINASTSAGAVTTADTSGVLQLQTGGTTALTVDASQNVGIGTTSNLASSKLDVRGRVRVGSGNSSGDAELIFSNYASATTAWDMAVRQDVGGANNDLKFLRFDSAGAYQGIAMQLDSSGNVGIGTSSPVDLLQINRSSGSGITSGISLTTAAGAVGDGSYIKWTGATAGEKIARIDGVMEGTDAGSIRFNTGNGTDGFAERARINSSGNLLVGETIVDDSGGVAIVPSTPASGACGILAFNKGNQANETCLRFKYQGTVVGSISYSNTATAYNTSSDYRLKDNIAPMTGALAKVALLKPVTYKWKVDGSDGQGFIAHELAEVEAGCVTGEKDAVDAEGNPQYQGIDTSFLVATLTAAIQEQQTLITQQAEAITALTTRITALEGAAA